jgi:hypothetical protein
MKTFQLVLVDRAYAGESFAQATWKFSIVLSE